MYVFMKIKILPELSSNTPLLDTYILPTLEEKKRHFSNERIRPPCRNLAQWNVSNCVCVGGGGRGREGGKQTFNNSICFVDRLCKSLVILTTSNNTSTHKPATVAECSKKTT